MEGALTLETDHEIRLRDAEYACAQFDPFIPPASGWRSEFNDLLEVPPHLAELAPLEGCKVLEFGCGDGRFTILMAQMGARIIAVDFSINALRKLAGFLPAGSAPTAIQLVRRSSAADLRWHVGLVQADASHFHIADRSFDRALSATPLDSRDQRMAMYRTIADALTNEGRYVGSVEHDDLIRRLLGLPISRRYTRGGIFIEHFDSATLRREVSPYFSKLRIRPIRPFVPFARRLPLAWAVRVSRMVGAAPGLRQLGEILLLRAELPVRPPVEGVNRPGNRLFKGLYRRYTLMIGKNRLWMDNEPV
jgi:SAM-dependent methyltransferase